MTQSSSRSVLARALGVFTDVHPGEGLTAVLLSLNIFLILTAYNDSTSGENGFGFGFFPEGLGRGVSSDALENSFNKQR